MNREQLTNNYGRTKFKSAQRSFPPSTDHSIYTIAKNAAIDITQYYQNTYGIQWYALRFFNVYMFNPNPFYHVDGIKRWISCKHSIAY